MYSKSLYRSKHGYTALLRQQRANANVTRYSRVSPSRIKIHASGIISWTCRPFNFNSWSFIHSSLPHQIRHQASTLYTHPHPSLAFVTLKLIQRASCQHKLGIYPSTNLIKRKRNTAFHPYIRYNASACVAARVCIYTCVLHPSSLILDPRYGFAVRNLVPGGSDVVSVHLQIKAS